MSPSTGATGAAGGSTTAVLMAAAGAAWEAEALERLSRGGPSLAVTRRCVDLTDLLAAAAAGTASVAVISPALPGLDADSLAELRRSGLTVVAVASPPELSDGDAERVRRMGVHHLLASTELTALVETVRTAGADGPPSPGDLGAADPDDPDGTGSGGPAGRLVAVWGPAGAPGRTTVAVGLATELAELGRDVLLLDADAYGGAVAAHLGVLDEVSGLLAASRAANAGQLDVERLSSVARQAGPRLRVLTGLPRPDRWREVRSAAFDDLLEQAARLSSYVVVDLGFSLEGDPVDPFGASGPQRNLMTLATLARADDVVVVGAADPVGLARLARGLVELDDVVPGAGPRVVVNRTRPSLGWSDQEIRSMVEGFARPVGLHFLPEDRAAADRALMAGKSLAESGDSSLRAAMAELARALLDDDLSSRRSRLPRRPRRLRLRRAGRAR